MSKMQQLVTNGNTTGRRLQSPRDVGHGVVAQKQRKRWLLNPHPPVPVLVNYHFTRKCNYECDFCFHTAKTSHVESLDAAKKGLRLLKDAGMRKINFSGGEPLLYPKLLGQLVMFCKDELHVESVSIVTNGSRVMERFLSMAGRCIDIIAVSCDSFREETNIKIGRGKGSHLQHVIQLSQLCWKYGIKFKLNTIVNRLNFEEDMNECIQEIQPFRWKCFQVLMVEGENNSDSTLRDASRFIIMDEEFAMFCKAHSGNNCFVAEPNNIMKSWYLILDEYMRFLNKGTGSPTPSILEVGVKEALKHVYWDQKSFYDRGGIYEWSKIAGDHSQTAGELDCPFKSAVHRHGLNSYTSGSRTSHCGGGGSYRYYFPVNEPTGRVAYKIDKSKARFINVCALQDLDEDSNEEEQLANEFSSKATISGDSTTESASNIDMYKAAQETVTIKLDDDQADEQKSIFIAVSDCVMGRVSQIQKYLHNSSDASIFLQGRDYSGDTTLIMASREKSSDMVSLLLDHDFNVNAVNHKGRSALMEAALWGRLDNTKLLMNRGADKSLRDYKKRRAVDLAQPMRKNQLERHLSAGGSIGISQHEPIYKEDTFNRDADRRQIVRLLISNDVRSKIVYGSPPTISECKDYSFRRSPNDQSIILCGPLANYPVTSDYKTVARLERGGQFPTIAAMSGWSHHELPSVQVSGRDLTDEVIRIAADVGYILTPDSRRDQDSPGRFHASHAEKQLIAYFIDRHVFLQ
ncbi:MAG: hypothetical protein M1840_000587 [Geoglossum simile]|nr:MAG: hypothetical protein M1840_000587 [Geoglossum simile]